MYSLALVMEADRAADRRPIASTHGRYRLEWKGCDWCTTCWKKPNLYLSGTKFVSPNRRIFSDEKVERNIGTRERFLLFGDSDDGVEKKSFWDICPFKDKVLVIGCVSGSWWRKRGSWVDLMLCQKLNTWPRLKPKLWDDEEQRNSWIGWYWSTNFLASLLSLPTVGC